MINKALTLVYLLSLGEILNKGLINIACKILFVRSNNYWFY